MASSQKLSDTEKRFVSDNIGDKLYELTIALKLSKTNKTEIRRQNTTYVQSGLNAIEKWEETCSKDATKPAMIKALRTINANDIADQLEDGLVSSAAAGIPAGTSVTPCPQPTGETYCQDKPGYCIIINNHKFAPGEGLTDFEGTAGDVDALKETFEKFNFLVRIKENTSADQILKSLQEFQEYKSKNEFFDCFVCCIMSHGDKGSVYGSDSLTLDIEDIVTSFFGDTCPFFNTTPKLFFIDACQGAKDLPGVSRRGVSDTSSRIDDSSMTSSTPIAADILIYVSTIPGYTAFMRSASGSPFIQHLTKTLNDHGDKQNITDILTTVNREMANEDFGENIKQQPVYSTTLNKSLIFKRK